MKDKIGNLPLYISESGKDTNNGETIDTPKKTLLSAIAVLLASGRTSGEFVFGKEEKDNKDGITANSNI